MRNTMSRTSLLKSWGKAGQASYLFLEDWELARVALSCHLALNILCQEMQEAWLLWHGCLFAHCCSVLKVSPNLEVLQQFGEGCDGKTSRGACMKIPKVAGKDALK